jgi:hypothetical protein
MKRFGQKPERFFCNFPDFKGLLRGGLNHGTISTGCEKLSMRYFALLFVFVAPAMGYIGPGVSAGTVSSLIGAVLAVSMLVIGTVAHPLRLLVLKFKKLLGLS